MKVSRFLCVLSRICTIIFILGTFVGCGYGASKENIVLRAGSSFAENDRAYGAYFFEFQKKITEYSDGKLELRWVGGPETFPTNQLSEAVRDGAIDFAWTTSGYQASAIPEGNIFYYTPYNWDEMRENGALDYFNAIQEDRMNSIVLGGNSVGLKFTLYTNKEIKTTDDFKGLRIRSSATYIGFIKGLGAEPIVMPMGEMYSALEKGIIDGCALGGLGVIDQGVHELLKYKIIPEYWMCQQFNIINKDTWDSLPDWAKDVIMKAQREIEAELPAYYDKLRIEEEAIIQKAGVKIITIQDADKYLKIAEESGWAYMEETVPKDAQALIDKFR